MGSAKGIIGRFGAFGETRQPALGAQGADAVTAFGQNFMGVALMRDIPDQFIPWGVEHRMQRHCQFNHAQSRTQMATSG